MSETTSEVSNVGYEQIPANYSGDVLQGDFNTWLHRPSEAEDWPRIDVLDLPFTTEDIEEARNVILSAETPVFGLEAITAMEERMKKMAEIIGSAEIVIHLLEKTPFAPYLHLIMTEGKVDMVKASTILFHGHNPFEGVERVIAAIEKKLGSGEKFAGLTFLSEDDKENGVFSLNSLLLEESTALGGVAVLAAAKYGISLGAVLLQNYHEDHQDGHISKETYALLRHYYDKGLTYDQAWYMIGRLYQHQISMPLQQRLLCLIEAAHATSKESRFVPCNAVVYNKWIKGNIHSKPGDLIREPIVQTAMQHILSTLLSNRGGSH